ncbi:MAG TPA: carboxymuconolactone decarboxylase family protein [Nocardioidaceae bacterium]|nr:carboxymuconolactone decarboxylase family protein [Nocardioidaceae bacterium]
MSDHAGRLPLLAPETLDPDQRALYDAILGGPRGTGPFSVADDRGRLQGPFNALLHTPGIGAAVERLGAVLRFDGTLDDRTRELVICAVAAHWGSDYEWYAHSRMARASGVSAAELESLRGRTIPDGLTRAEDAAMRLATALLRDRTVDAGVYHDAAEHQGPGRIVELCALVGYYQLLAGVLAAADVPAPADEIGEQAG